MTADATATKPKHRARALGAQFAIAFLLGAVLVVGAGGAGLYAYGQQYYGRVLPGVLAGGVDLSGLDPAAAEAAILAAHSELSGGTITLTGPNGEITIGYPEVGRKADTRAMLDEALVAGRHGEPVADLIGAAADGAPGGECPARRGLDATVFISGGGSKQTMSWTNDTKYPVLIRGINTRSGGIGYVTFQLYSVPSGRKVVIGKATVKNQRQARDTVQYTSSLRAGQSERIEYPVDGMDVWRTVTVYQNGKVLRRTTYYSHYATITGILLRGKGTVVAEPTPTASQTP